MRPARKKSRTTFGMAQALVAWYRRNRRDLPWRRTSDPYAIWIAEIMLQQTTVQAVVPYYTRFMVRFPDLETLARARLPTVLAAWSGLGYYRRARNLHSAARLIVADHGGRFPDTAAGVLALPGIGRYTAGAILSIAFGQRQPVLDGNVARVLSRVLLIRGDAQEAGNKHRLWQAARELVELSKAPGDLNQALMELGATICTPIGPDCPSCPLARRCAARRAGEQEAIPRPRRRRTPIQVKMSVAVVERDGRFLLRRREGTRLMDGLWELPTLDPPRGGAGRAGRGNDPPMRKVSRLDRIRHTITYRRLEVEVCRARLLSEPWGSRYRWVSMAQARKLPTSSLVTKVFERLRN